VLASEPPVKAPSFHLVQEFLVGPDPVQNLVAFPAQRDQVGLRFVAKRAAPSDVVNIEVP
jgi:hypothetical protein